MDRRHFLKTTALGAGVLTLGTAPTKAQTIKAKTPLEVKGYVTEPAKQIPVVDTADVVIVGGGPAGFAAAIAAARQGVSVLLLERQYFLGGLFTGCKSILLAQTIVLLDVQSPYFSKIAVLLDVQSP